MASVSTSVYGKLADKTTSVHRYDLKNGKGLCTSFLDYGATLLSVQAPDRDGCVEEVTLNLTSMEELLTKNMYYGSTVGRVANRVAEARFTLEDKEYVLAANNGPNHLHGGTQGFDQRVWTAQPFQTSEAVGVIFSLQSPDGEEGYPGNVTVQATYRLLTQDNVLEMDFWATTDAPTPLALTNHAYWNLSGGCKRTAHEHTLRVAASRVLALGPHQIPTGEFQPVAGTPFDLQQQAEEGGGGGGVLLGSRIPHIDGGGKPGFDHCFVVDGYDPSASRGVVVEKEQEEPDATTKTKARYMATLADPTSGRAMDVMGTQPGIQVYTANWLSSDNDASSIVKPHNAVCLETEFYPNAINDPTLGNVDEAVLRPGQVYRHFTAHRFYTLRAAAAASST